MRRRQLVSRNHSAEYGLAAYSALRVTRWCNRWRNWACNSALRVWPHEGADHFGAESKAPRT